MESQTATPRYVSQLTRETLGVPPAAMRHILLQAQWHANKP